MRLYSVLSAAPRPASYLGKILTVSFIGVHMPMIVAVLYVLLSADMALADSVNILVALLLATLAALYWLLEPVSAAAQALRAYLENRTIPSLPTRYDDRAGVLMANVQEVVTRLDIALDTAEAQRDEAMRIHREKFALLASMSHDLHTPLNHVIGFAELISAEALGPVGTTRYRSYANDIRDSGGDLLTSLQDVLDLSAAEAGRMTFDAQPHGLGDVVQRTTNLMHHQAEAQGIRLLAVLGPAVDLMVIADGRSLKQMLMQSIQVAMAAETQTFTVRIDTDRAAGMANVVVQGDRSWSPHDVPPEMTTDAGLRPQAGLPDGDGFPSSNPTALRLSLIASLAKLTQVRFRVGGGASGRQIVLQFPLLPAQSQQQAA
ncbi:sensor histidine kinase [Marinibaculum pumilum]|uniref:histidine kinase n=1 Tax=Marinibaculum pumilum TaxID=1766165 RepID=A0ABV7L171_9PROT